MATDVDRLRIIYELDDKPAAQAFRRMEDAMNRANAELKRGGAEAQKAVKALGDEGLALKRKFDPAYDAAKRFREEAKKLAALYDAGGINAKRYRDGIEGLANKFGQAGDAAKVNSYQMRQFGGSLQNFGWQVGDFATQVGAGTSATQALGQQLPQLLGGFGAFGALAGAAAAVIIPLAASLLKSSDDAGTLKERMDALSKATDAYAEAAERAARPVSALRGEMGALADLIDSMDNQALLLAEAQARVAMRNAGKGIVKEFGIVKFADPETAKYDRLAKSLDISEENAKALVRALRLVDTASSPEQALRSAKLLRDVMIEMAGSADQAASKFGENFDTIKEYINGAESIFRTQRSESEKLFEEYSKNTNGMKDLQRQLTLVEEEYRGR